MISAFLAAAPALQGCLVPLPLDEQVPDGGSMLIVQQAVPPFGTLQATKPTAPFQFSVQVQSDSTMLAGRLCVQVNQSCCVLNPDDPSVTKCPPSLVAQISPIGGEPGSAQFEVSFPDEEPCTENPMINTVYVVPVITTGGFIQSDGGASSIMGLGTIDAGHYWTVRCP